MNDFNNLLKIICQELNIKLTISSDGWLKILEKDNVTHYITGYRFDNNGYATSEIMNDKGLFYDVMTYKNIPVVEQKVLFHNYEKNEVLAYFNNHNREIIIKGNTGNAGKEVFKINKEEDLFIVIDKLFQKEYSISLSPFYDIKNEYRIVVLNKKIRLIFGKIKPFVLGDGKKNVMELASEINYFSELENPLYIPKKDEKIELNFKFNLSSGGRVFLNIDDDVKNKLERLALMVANNLNILFASIDIIVTRDEEILVMEANSGVTLNRFLKQNPGYFIVIYNIYKDAIKLMFS